MNNFFKILSVFVFCVVLASCSKSDTVDVLPLRDYTEQYTTDINSIENYLKTHFITVVNNPGANDDQNITLTLIPTGGTQISIWDQTTYPLQSINVDKDGIVYKLYYLKLREGSGATSKSPCNADGVLTAYKGQLLDGTVFDSNFYPQSYLYLSQVIRGWSELFPKFKTGTYTANPDGTITNTNFGAGVMFLPSGLGYYSQSTTAIPSYSPLIFNFKLFEVQRVDNDADGIYSFQEDINGDGYLRDNDVTFEDDTDQDGTPDFLDTDDDNDGYTTKFELKYLVGGETFYYDFANIPLCTGTSNGKKRHLDANCHN
ncbi:FKBP-type peptidyl-prolyl cis-trans isomerase [Flavobacterium sp.]|uniref:FKBP-type peptidyl-prolyl cis-trans isomerase n=1 Tax=Flavobacterium sp. TaxID=239 RepID=UPI003751778F